MRSSTDTLIAALRVLADEIDSPDGAANAAIAEAADRMEELRDTLAMVCKRAVTPRDGGMH